MRQSKRIEKVQTPVIPVVGRLIQENPGTISLGQGVVGYPPPPSVFRAIEEFGRDPENHKYKGVDGIPRLLEALENKLREDNGIRIDGQHALMATAGGNMAFINALLAVADPGDEILLQTPYYFNHEMAAAMMNCRAVLVPTDSNYHLQPERIRGAITAKTRAVVTISPNNPSGAVYSEQSLREVNRLCGDRGVYHIHDEAYEYFHYEGAGHFSPGAIPDGAGHTISLFSLSKSYGFASWRIGCMVFPRFLADAVRKIQDTNLICPPVISQYAAAAALEAGKAYCLERMRPMAKARVRVLDALGRLGEGIQISKAEGAFYVLLKIGCSLSDMELTTRLIREHRVAAIPGSAFGLKDGCYLRVAYGALDEKTVMEGIQRLTGGLAAIIKDFKAPL